MRADLRPLLIAEAANPEWVSVPLVGWSLADAIQRATNAHIVTQIRNREAFLRAGKVEGEDFTAIDSERYAGFAWKVSQALRMGEGKGWTVVTAVNGLAYPYFERLVWEALGDRITAGEFDLVHRITPLTPTAISPIAAKCAAAGVPFVMGPLNGGVPWPAGFDAERRREKEWLSYIRGAYRMMPGRGKTLEAARAIIAGSRHTAGEIPEKHQDKVVWIPENAIDPARFPLEPKARADGPLRACFIGRLVPYKGADMLIEAAAPLLRDGAMTLDIIGDGPMLEDLKALAAREGAAEAATFHGWVEHGDVQRVARAADLFAFPSVREFGGGVVLEAMALGLPPLIVDYAGPGELVDGDVGFKVPIGTRAEIIAGFRGKLTEIAAAPAALAPIGAAAQERVRQRFTWDRKAEQVVAVYDWVLGARTDRPDPVAQAQGAQA